MFRVDDRGLSMTLRVHKWPLVLHETLMTNPLDSLSNETSRVLRALQASPPPGGMDLLAAIWPRVLADLGLLSHLSSESRILEIGAWPYVMTFALQQLGYRVDSVDLDPSRDVEYLDARGLRVQACDIEAEALPFDDHSFDVVVFAEVLEHMGRNAMQALQEMRRVLRPGGMLFVTTPNLYSPANILAFITGRGLAFTPTKAFQRIRGVGHLGHIREYAAKEARELLQCTGFSVEKTVFRLVGRSRGGSFAKLFYRLLPSLKPHVVYFCTADEHRVC